MTDLTPVSKKKRKKKKTWGKDYVWFKEKKRREKAFVKGFIGRSMLRIHGENTADTSHFIQSVFFVRFR